MSRVIQFFNNLTWQDMTALVGVIFGLISTIAYWEQRRSAKAQEAIAEFARRNVDKKVSIEEIQKLDEQKALMKRQVLEEIPRLARVSVLKEQAEIHSHAISEHYKQWQVVTQELGESFSVGKIDQSIESVILDRLLPHYEFDRKQQILRDRITVLSVAMVISGRVFPDPLDVMLQITLGLFLAITILRLIGGRARSNREIEFIKTILLSLYIGVFILIGGFGILLFSVGSVTDLGKILRPIMIIISLSGLMGAKWYYGNLDKWLKLYWFNI